MDIISIHNVLFEVLGYQVSLIELIGTITGLICVWYSVRANVLTWPIGIINAAAFLILFYQVNLYSDMFLQVWFIIIGIYGWINWSKKDAKKTISRLDKNQITLVLFLVTAGTIFIGSYMSHIHEMLPQFFSQPAAYPYFDAFTTTASIIAVVLMAQKKIETWVLWISVDIVCIVLYILKGILFMSVEYFLFSMLATSGLITWIKFLKNEKRTSIR